VKGYTGAWNHGDDELPAANDKEYKRGGSKHAINTEIISESLIRKLLVVFCPKLDPYS
jgi:hypothetical protein